MANCLLCTVRNIRQWKKLVVHTFPRKNLLHIQCNIVHLFAIQDTRHNTFPVKISWKARNKHYWGADYFSIPFPQKGLLRRPWIDENGTRNMAHLRVWGLGTSHKIFDQPTAAAIRTLCIYKEVSHPVEGQRAKQWQGKMQELRSLVSIYEFDAQPPLI